MSIYIGFWTFCSICVGFYTIKECVRHICESRSKIWENKAKIKFMDSKFVDAEYK